MKSVVTKLILGFVFINLDRILSLKLIFSWIWLILAYFRIKLKHFASFSRLSRVGLFLSLFQLKFKPNILSLHLADLLLFKIILAAFFNRFSVLQFIKAKTKIKLIFSLILPKSKLRPNGINPGKFLSLGFCISD